MQLLGSNSSPFVRRIRVWAYRNAISLDFKNLDIFAKADREIMIHCNPARKIPILIDDAQTITDSNVIIRYLLEKNQQPRFNWQQENLLTVINACNDSLVELLLCQRSGFNTGDDKLFFNLQNERITETLTYLNTQTTESVFKSCEYLNISLYCLLDWIYFRELTDFSHLTHLTDFYEQFAQQPAIQLTDPRHQK
ncbi:glutathione S-transferase family protein [Pseudoalteromonas mariniglutinosa]|uniref:glutathione S-transferase family protein n=1 Tax=Pseudoalteromonas mariniglutinosa TaxID=206042 RepID=UPI00384FCB73